MRTEIEIAYHLGAPNTDNNQITWSLRKDANLLTERGVLIRRPKLYLGHIKKAIAELDGKQQPVADQEMLLQAITRGADAKRVILSSGNFLGVPAWMFYGGGFYPNAGKTTKALRNLFPDNPCEFFLGIANPATFIPAAFKMQEGKKYEEFMGDTNLATVRWSDVVARIQEANPGCPVTIWSNEDTPVIWPTVLHEIIKLDSDVRLSGEMDIIREIMSEKGFGLLEKYLHDRPNLTEKQRRQIRALFLEKFYLEDAVDETIDLPGWTHETVGALTQIYESDLKEIRQMPNVKFLSH